MHFGPVNTLVHIMLSKHNKDSSTAKEVRLRFLMSPKLFQPSKSDPSTVGSVVCERTRLEGDPGQQVAVGTGQLETIPANLVSRLI